MFIPFERDDLNDFIPKGRRGLEKEYNFGLLLFQILIFALIGFTMIYGILQDFQFFTPRKMYYNDFIVPPT